MIQDEFELDEDSWDELEDAEDEEEDDEEFSSSLSREDFQQILHDLPKESAVIFHGLTLLLCRKLLEGGSFAKYHKAVMDVFKAVKPSSILKRKEDAVVHAEEVLMKLERNILNPMSQGTSRWRRPSASEGRFLDATDICLKYVSTSLSEEQIMGMIKRLRNFKNGVNKNREMENYAFVFYQCTYDEINPFDWGDYDSVLKDEDWVDESDDYGEAPEDWEFEDENYALEEQNYDIEEYSKLLEERYNGVEILIKDFSFRLEVLKDARDIILHATVLKMMMSTVRPRVFAKYWRYVRYLLYTYIGNSNSKTSNDLSEVRKETDDLLAKKQWILLSYPFFNYSVDGIGEFNLLSTAIEICLSQITNMEKDEVVGLINSLICNDITYEYFSEDIDSLARACLEKAKHQILADDRLAQNNDD